MVNNVFEHNIITLYGQAGKQWIADLPQIVSSYALAWNLDNLQPVNNLSYNYVSAGFQHEKPIILKLSLDHVSINKEAFALKHFAGYGAVTVLEKADNALLLQRAVPGDSLKNLLPTNKMNPIKICCEVMSKLHQATLPTKDIFPSIQDWLKILDQEWNIPTHYMQKARELKDKLLMVPGNQVLLHGDLHHDNILANNNEWVVIDPKGVIGQPINEFWAFIVDIEEDTQYVAEFFNYDLKLVRQWYFVHLILSICWNLEDKLSPEPFLELAAKAYRMLE